MRKEMVEIYSDATNAAIMRHPVRHFPGLLLQGDTLNGLWMRAERLCSQLDRHSKAWDEARDLRDSLAEFRLHYIRILGEHEIPLPFNDTQFG